MTRKCRGAEYLISVTNSGGNKPKLSVGGKAIEGNIVPYAAPGSVVMIDCKV